MPARRFLDTNILIYAFAAGEPKGVTASELLADGGTISIQVLNEFANVSRRKLALDWREIAKRLDLVKSLLGTPVPLTVAIHDAARELARARKIEFYDALIVAAALAAKCDQLMTEHLQHGAKFGKLEIVNPF